jgi:hypothetical protein
MFQVDLFGHRCRKNKEAKTSDKKTIAKENKK